MTWNYKTKSVTLNLKNYFILEEAFKTLRVMKKMNRRKFMTSAATAASFMIIPRHVLGGKGFTAPSDKVNVGLIGAGGKGKENVQ